MKTKKLGDLYPFTEESVRAMVKRANGNISAVLDWSEKLLDDGSRAGYPVIDEEFVRKVLA